MESRGPDDLPRPPEGDTPDPYSRVNSTVQFTPHSDLDAAGDESAGERAEEETRRLADRAREGAREARHRASDAAGRAREKAAGTFDRARDRLERSGTLGVVRQNPLAALGLAVGIGFLLAGSNDPDVDTRISRARQQLKGAAVGSLSAVIAREARGFLGLH